MFKMRMFESEICELDIVEVQMAPSSRLIVNCSQKSLLSFVLSHIPALSHHRFVAISLSTPDKASANPQLQCNIFPTSTPNQETYPIAIYREKATLHSSFQRVSCDWSWRLRVACVIFIAANPICTLMLWGLSSVSGGGVIIEGGLSSKGLSKNAPSS